MRDRREEPVVVLHGLLARVREPVGLRDVEQVRGIRIDRERALEQRDRLEVAPGAKQLLAVGIRAASTRGAGEADAASGTASMSEYDERPLIS